MAENVSIDETQQLLEEVKAAEIKKKYDEELRIYRQNQLILQAIKKVDVDKLANLSDEGRENVRRYIDYVHVVDHLDENDSVGKPYNILSR